MYNKKDRGSNIEISSFLKGELSVVQNYLNEGQFNKRSFLVFYHYPYFNFNHVSPNVCQTICLRNIKKIAYE